MKSFRDILLKSEYLNRYIKNIQFKKQFLPRTKIKCYHLVMIWRVYACLWHVYAWLYTCLSDISWHDMFMPCYDMLWCYVWMLNVIQAQTAWNWTERICTLNNTYHYTLEKIWIAEQVKAASHSITLRLRVSEGAI